MMTRLIDDAIAALRDVPPEQQDAIALAVLALAGKDKAIYTLTPEELADLKETDAEIERGDIATDDAVRALWAKYGL